jgi:hypothetical protein
MTTKLYAVCDMRKHTALAFGIPVFMTSSLDAAWYAFQTHVAQDADTYERDAWMLTLCEFQIDASGWTNTWIRYIKLAEERWSGGPGKIYRYDQYEYVRTPFNDAHPIPRLDYSRSG